jgi:hypothetical protein
MVIVFFRQLFTSFPGQLISRLPTPLLLLVDKPASIEELNPNILLPTLGIPQSHAAHPGASLHAASTG